MPPTLTPALLLALGLAALAPLAAAEPVTFDSADPPYTECVESVLRWSGGKPPYAVKAKIGPDNDRQFRTLRQHLNETTWNYTVDMPAGTDLELWIQDSSGETEAKPGDASIRSYIRVNPEEKRCPIFLFPGQTLNSTASTVTMTKTVVETPSASASAGAAADAAEAAQGEQTERNSNAGPIAGGVVGGVLGAALLGACLWYIWRLRRQLRRQSYGELQSDGGSPTRQANASQPTLAAVAGSAAAGASSADVGSSSGPGSSAGAPAHQAFPSPGYAPAAYAGSHSPRTLEPNLSPEIKIMQLDAMLGPNSPGHTPSDSPSPGYFPAENAPGTPRPEHASEYEVDAGPAFAPPAPAPRVVHPPQYRDVGKA